MQPLIDFAFQTFCDPQLQGMLGAAQKFADDLLFMRLGKIPPRWLSLLGTSGVGKTHLARTIYDKAWCRLSQDIPGHVHEFGGWSIRWRDWIGSLKSGDRDIRGAVRVLHDAPFVVLDDFGAERDPSGFSAETFGQVVDGRLRKPTIITSNLTLAQIGAIDARIASRLLRNGSEVIEVDTTDFNLRKRS